MLWSFAVAQPLLDLLGDAPEFFVARENTRADILVLAFGVTLVPPLVLVALEAAVSAVSRRARAGLHLVLIATLTAAFALQVLVDAAGGRGAVLVPVAAALGVGAAALYARTRAVPLLLTVLGPAPLVFLAIFLLVSPVSRLVLPGEEVEASTVTVPGRTPVVMIVFDELSGVALMGRDGRINARRFPSFARLSREATWYRNATTVADFTTHAVPALLTGERPDLDAAPIASDHPESLFTLLGGDYAFDVTEPLTDVCPERLCPEGSGGSVSFARRLRDLGSDLSLVSLHLLLPDDMADDLPPVDRSFGNFRAADDPEAGRAAQDPGGAERALQGLVAFTRRAEVFGDFNRRLARTSGGARLHFLHVELPHNPYTFLPTGQRYPETLTPLPGTDQPGATAGTWRADPWLARQGLQRYVLQVQYADRLLGRALAALRASGVYERALIVVAADHGASFEPGLSHRAATGRTLPQIANVPLLVKAPGQDRGRLADANVNTTDVLPTIADELGVELPWPADGRPAARARRGGVVRLTAEFTADDLSLPFAEFVRRRDSAVASMLDRIGTTDRELFAGSPDDDLVGRRVASLAAPPSRGRFELDAGGLFAAVDPEGPVVPALVTGRVAGVAPGARLAVAAGGRVAAVTVPFDDDGVRRFSAVVPPAAYARGANDVEVLAVRGRGAGRRLERLRGVALGYRITRAGGSDVLVDAAGRRIPVVASAARGSVDLVTADANAITVGGWAGTGRPPRAADRVVAFAGDRFLATARPSEPRADIARELGRGLTRSGFKLVGGGTAAPGVASSVRVYALAGGRASLLPSRQAPPP